MLTLTPSQPTTTQPPMDLIFRTSRLWLALKLTGIIILGGGSIQLTISTDWRWLAAAISFALLAIYCIVQYHYQVLIIQTRHIVWRHGYSILQEDSLPLLNLKWRIEQTPFEWLLGHGTLLLFVDNTTLVLPHLAHVRQISRMLRVRQAASMLTATIIDSSSPHNRYQAA